MPNVRYEYSCAKCGGKVTKPPLGVESGLHGWQCDECGRGIKVKRKLNKEE
jgi:DNA-directed RNA polymerase subunit RPC12/RpoP